jgi:hypothetical protein
MAANVVVRLDPRDPQLGLLTPFLAQRIMAYAALQQQAEVIPAAYAGQVMGELWKGTPGILALGIVTPETGALVGHVLAVVVAAGPKIHVAVVQFDVPPGARPEALADVRAWAKVLGAPDVLLQYQGRAKDLEKLGAIRLRTVYRLPVEPPAEP